MNPETLEPQGPDTAAVPTIDNADEQPRAWEEIAPGRFMPRRVRGSCQGRALG
jgi:hypothetical protein